MNVYKRPLGDHMTDAEVENYRRDCLARYLLRGTREEQKAFFQGMKSEAARTDIKARMLEQLALQIAAEDDNRRKLRLARLYNRCMSTRKPDDMVFFRTINHRVKEIIKNKEGVCLR